MTWHSYLIDFRAFFARVACFRVNLATKVRTATQAPRVPRATTVLLANKGSLDRSGNLEARELRAGMETKDSGVQTAPRVLPGARAPRYVFILVSRPFFLPHGWAREKSLGTRMVCHLLNRLGGCAAFTTCAARSEGNSLSPLCSGFKRKLPRLAACRISGALA